MIVSSVAPVASADSPPARCQTSEVGGYCAFSCNAGDIIVASGVGAGANASCGGASAACDASPDCLDAPSIARHSGTGRCDMTTEGEYADCFALPRADGVAACSTSVAYAACAYSCAAEADLNVSAIHTAGNAGYPRVLSVCGGGSASCQAHFECWGSGYALHQGHGVCLSRTIETNVSCSASAAGYSQNDAGSGGDATSSGLSLTSGTYAGALVTAQYDYEDGYRAMAWTPYGPACRSGNYSVHIEGAGVQVRLRGSWGDIILDTPADFRAETCVDWQMQPLPENVNSSEPLFYSMTLVTPTEAPLPPRPAFAVSELTVTPENGTEGAPGIVGANVTIAFTVTNVANASGSGSAGVSIMGTLGIGDWIPVEGNVSLDPGDSTRVQVEWNSRGSLGRLNVTASASTAWSNDRESTYIIVGAPLPGNVGIVGSAIVGPLSPPSVLDRPAGTALDAIDTVCGNQIVRLVDRPSTGGGLGFCDRDYNGENGGFTIPFLSAQICNDQQPSTIYRTIAEQLRDKPPCSPTLNQTAHAVAPLVDDGV